jgi:beta-lactam-binding protein with PASTA domain
MAARPDDPGTDEDGAPDPSADTLADDAWPVSDLYDVQPDEAGSLQVESGAPARPGRRFPPRVGAAPVLVVAVLLAVLGALGLAAWSSSSDDPAAEAAPESRPATTTEPPTSTAPSAGPQTEPVPDVVGSTYASASSRLESAGLEPLRRVEPSDRPEGEVLGQSPAAGASAERGTTVVITVSSGPDRVSVPALEGLMAGAAARAIREAGLELDLQAERSSEPKGTVLAQQPPTGASIEPGSAVTLRVSSGPAVELKDVPDLAGLTVATARSRLQTLGLRSTVIEITSSRPAGTVVGQSPGAGTELRAGSTVRLRVSSGPTTVTVPDVTGLDGASARARLRALGLTVETVDEPTSDPGEDGFVVAQDPAPGMDAEDRTTVVLTIARFA